MTQANSVMGYTEYECRLDAARALSRLADERRDRVYSVTPSKSTSQAIMEHPGYAQLVAELTPLFPPEHQHPPPVLYVQNNMKLTSFIYASWCPFHKRVHRHQHWFVTTYRDSGRTYAGCFKIEDGARKPSVKLDTNLVVDFGLTASSN